MNEIRCIYYDSKVPELHRCTLKDYGCCQICPNKSTCDTVCRPKKNKKEK